MLLHTDDNVFCLEVLISDCDVIGVGLSLCSRVPREEGGMRYVSLGSPTMCSLDVEVGDNYHAYRVKDNDMRGDRFSGRKHSWVALER